MPGRVLLTRSIVGPLWTDSVANHPPAQVFIVTPSPDDARLDGIGIVHGGGTISVLLRDYPELQWSDILDLLYAPRFGASVSTLLVEIPGDGNATQKSMPTHQHTRDDLETRRGYTCWVLVEAKRRNGTLSLDAVARSAPDWVGDGDFWSLGTTNYYVSWLRSLRNNLGLELDAIDGRSKKGVNLGFAKTLLATLDRENFGSVRIHALDSWPADKFDFVGALQYDPPASEAIDIPCAHVLYQRPDEQTPREGRRWAREQSKAIWNTEEHVYRQGFDCLVSLVKCANEDYSLSGATKSAMWYGIAGIELIRPHPESPAMVLTRETWSGHYVVRELLSEYVLYWKLTGDAWIYVFSSGGALPAGRTVVAIHAEWQNNTLVIDSKNAKEAQAVKFFLDPEFCVSALCCLRNDSEQQFARASDVPADGLLSVAVEPNIAYSISTARSNSLLSERTEAEFGSWFHNARSRRRRHGSPTRSWATNPGRTTRSLRASCWNTGTAAV